MTAWTSTGTQQQAADEAASAPLAAILNAAPFGLVIEAGDGRRVFANGRGLRAGEGGEPGSEQSLRTMTFGVEAGGSAYSLALTLDQSEQQRLEDELFERAYFDELTRLPNRSLIEKAIDQLIGSGASSFALAFIDLDGFKNINDFYGHAVGDQLLIGFAARVSASLRPTDLLARLSGDEFLLLLTPVDDAAELSARLTDLASHLQAPHYVEGYEIFSSASLGVSRYPSDGTTYYELVSNADRAMYRGKKGRKGQIQFFDASIEHVAVETSRLEQRLRLAIRDRRVRCAYQPKVEFRTGRVTGVEALMRWRDEDGIIQAPGGMIELAAELGLMDQLTHLIVEEVVAALPELEASFGADISMSLNVAAKQATNVPFMQSLLARLDATGHPTRFMIELTEEALLAKAEFRTHILPMIREVGTRLSIDDFGVGYSSLATLADLTADELKVDRSFITDIHIRPRNQSVLKAIESLGASLGMSVVVEGVETYEELAYLQAATRIQLAQGYYFARPMLLEDVRPAAVGEALRAPPALRPDRQARAGNALRA
ncbi:putative bifunctional diguanylate cyclase/phosphodiesterase [Phreatobacter sp.]|uniref:putative bifunctional diguanylate cyclase/phosphodiesterase n=1 Tax=Phreatobacter sp. TaxID=1966341 RepID=UPI003F72DC52